MSLLDVEEPVNVSGRKLVIEGLDSYTQFWRLQLVCCELMVWAIEKCYL